MSHRPDQIASVLHRAVQSIITEGLADPRLDAMITVTGVTVGADLQEAVVSIAVSPEEKGDLALHGLRAASGFIRRKAGERVALHRPPRLVFKIDKALRKQQAVLATLAEIAREREESAPATPTVHPTPTPDSSPRNPPRMSSENGS